MIPRTAHCLCLLLVCLTASSRVGAKDAPAQPDHVVLVILGGGVRAEDMLDEKLMPAVAAMAKQGRVVKKIESGAPDGYAAAARILTGRDDGLDGARLGRPPNPTLCEYVRRARDLPAEKVWFVSCEGGDHLALAASTHARYGTVFAPSVAYGIGAFAQPLESLLAKLGRPVPTEGDAWGQVRRLRRLSRQLMSVWLPRSVDAGLPRSEVVERALLREIDRKALLVEGPNPKDVLAFRAARNVIEIHRPVLTVIRLGEAEQAQASFEQYRAVLAANDKGIARLQAATAADKQMAGRTTFVVVADRGRNEKADAKGALGEDDESRGRQFVALVASGPGLARRGKLKGDRSIDDVCPTVAQMLGVEASHGTGRIWMELLAPR